MGVTEKQKPQSRKGVSSRRIRLTVNRVASYKQDFYLLLERFRGSEDIDG